VLVIVTDVAVTVVGTVGALDVDRPRIDAAPVEPVPLDTITQSPFASDDRVVDDVEVKRVSELKSMVSGPLVTCTAALDALAAMTSPETEENDAADAPVELAPVVAATEDGDEPPPHAASTTARAAPPAAYVANRAVRRDDGADTVAPLMRAARSTGLFGA
jgi:type IV secretory pathway VirB10-like protein